MRIFKFTFLLILLAALVCSFAFAMHHTPEDRGKALFSDPKFAGGQKACNECHPNGKGLENAADKKEFNIMGKKQKGLEEAVNFCIVNANKGKAIDVKSEQMKDMVAYIRSLMGKMMEKKTGGY
jgi:mono/diheme cytochrome c family protein